VPYEGTVSYLSGTAAGPRAILEASRQVEKLDEEFLEEFGNIGIATVAPVAPAKTPEEEMRRVARAAGRILDDGKFLLTLGGEHSISSPIVRMAAKVYDDLSVLQIDAHGDLRDTYTQTPYSHGAVMRRILEVTPDICQVGIRSFSKEELDDCPDRVRKFFTPRKIARQADWIARVLKMLTRRVYITIDIDGFDPAFAPGTGTPEPGGLDWYQVTDLLREVCRKRQVVAADIVEVRPIPPGQQTEYLAARLAYKIITYTHAARRGRREA
jgi:agmatinase